MKFPCISRECPWSVVVHEKVYSKLQWSRPGNSQNLDRTSVEFHHIIFMIDQGPGAGNGTCCHAMCTGSWRDWLSDVHLDTLVVDPVFGWQWHTLGNPFYYLVSTWHAQEYSFSCMSYVIQPCWEFHKEWQIIWNYRLTRENMYWKCQRYCRGGTLIDVYISPDLEARWCQEFYIWFLQNLAIRKMRSEFPSWLNKDRYTP